MTRRSSELDLGAVGEDVHVGEARGGHRANFVEGRLLDHREMVAGPVARAVVDRAQPIGSVRFEHALEHVEMGFERHVMTADEQDPSVRGATMWRA